MADDMFDPDARRLRRQLAHDQLRELKDEQKAWLEAWKERYPDEDWRGVDSWRAMEKKRRHLEDEIEDTYAPWDRDPLWRHAPDLEHPKFVSHVEQVDEERWEGWSLCGDYLRDVFRGNVSALHRSFNEYVSREASYKIPSEQPEKGVYSRTTLEAMLAGEAVNAVAVEYLVRFADEIASDPAKYILPDPVPEIDALADWMKQYARQPWWRDVLGVVEFMTPSQFHAFSVNRPVKRDTLEELHRRCVAFRQRVAEACERVRVIAEENSRAGAPLDRSQIAQAYIDAYRETGSVEAAIDAGCEVLRLKYRLRPFITPANLDASPEFKWNPHWLDKERYVVESVQMSSLDKEGVEVPETVYTEGDLEREDRAEADAEVAKRQEERRQAMREFIENTIYPALERGERSD